MQTDLTLQRPVAGPPAELLLLFHGVGSSAEDMAPLGQMLAAQRPQAWVVCVRSPHRSDLGQGWQWLSVQGVTETNRPERVATAMPLFVQRVRDWQRQTGVGPQGTTLIGFSQGAIMALESTQQTDDTPLARRVIAMAGRFAQAPRRAPQGTTVHLMHGEQDGVMPISLAEAAERALRALGADTTLERFAGLGHGIDARVAAAMARRLDTPAITLIRFDDDCTVLTPQGAAECVLNVGSAAMAQRLLVQTPPSPAAMERAIDVVEDALTASGLKKGTRGDLQPHDPALFQRLGLPPDTQRLTREQVEARFQRLASVSLGHPLQADDPPATPEAAALLLVLRECMHHLGYEGVVRG